MKLVGINYKFAPSPFGNKEGKPFATQLLDEKRVANVLGALVLVHVKYCYSVMTSSIHFVRLLQCS